MKETMNYLSSQKIKTVILAGGKGTRLYPLISDLPKPMILIGGKPLLEHLLNHSIKYGFSKFIFKTGYLSDKIEDYFKDGANFSCSIDYFIEKDPLGTCGGLNYLKSEKYPLIIIYGDVLLNLDLSKLLSYHFCRKAQATVVVHKSSHPEDSDIVVLDDDNRIVKIIHKPGSDQFGNISNAALYILNPECFSEIPEKGIFDFGKDLLPKLIEKEYGVFGYRTEEYIKDVGTIKRYEEANSDISFGKVFNRVEAVFLDRDGVINVEIGLLHKKEDLTLISDVPQSIKLLNDTNIPAIVITNQPVVARNLCTIQDLENIHNFLRLLLQKNGAYLGRIYYCPHHPDKGFPEENVEYKLECDCRKPKIGMLLKAKNDYQIDLSKCFMIGDTSIDIKTGSDAGCRTILVKTGRKEEDKKYWITPDYTFECLLDAVTFICKYNNTSFEKIMSSINQKIQSYERVVVLIGGCSKDQKSSLVNKIKDVFPTDSTIISLDDWAVEIDPMDEDSGLHKRFDYLQIAEDIHNLLQGGYISMKDGRHRFRLTGEKIIIIEGAVSLDIPYLLSISDLKIFVDSKDIVPLQSINLSKELEEMEYIKKTVNNVDYII